MTYLTNMIDNNNNQNTARLHLSCNSMVAANTTMSNDSIHSAKYTENAKTFREVHSNSINSSKQPTESMSTVGLASKLNYPLDNQHYHQHHHHWTHLSQPTNHHHHHNHHQAPTLLAGPSDNHLSHFDYFQSNYNQNVHEYHQPYVGYNNNTNSNNNGNGNNDATYQTETTQNNCYLYSHPYSQNQPTSSATTNYSGPHGHSHSSVNYLTYIDQPSQVEQSNLYYNNNNPGEDNQHITGPDYRSPLTYNNSSGHALTRQPEQYVLISPSTHASKYYHNYTSTSCVGQSTCLNGQELGHVSVGEDNSKAKVAPETAWTANFQGETINTSDSKTTTTTSEIPERHQVVAKSKSNLANAKSSRHVNGEATIIQQTKPTTTTNNQSKSSSNSASSSSSSSIRSSNQCHVCGRNYARPSTLKTHLRTHTNERPFKCNVCFKTFSQAANLTAHQRVHTGERPFSCPICGRQFSQSSSVITHLRTHSGERPYKCNMCSRTFSDSSTLTKHCRIHSGEKPYQCDYCPLNFSQSGNLSRHLKLHLMGSLQASSSSSNSSSSSSSSSSTSSSSSSTSAAHRMLTVT